MTLNLTVFLNQALHMEQMCYEDKFEDTLTLIRATPSIIWFQRKFKEYYWSPDGPGGQITVENLRKCFNSGDNMLSTNGTTG